MFKFNAYTSMAVFLNINEIDIQSDAGNFFKDCQIWIYKYIKSKTWIPCTNYNVTIV